MFCAEGNAVVALDLYRIAAIKVPPSATRTKIAIDGLRAFVCQRLPGLGPGLFYLKRLGLPTAR
jgi:hypothetical protein